MKHTSRFIRKPSLLEQLYLDASYMGYNITPRAYIKIDRPPARPLLEDALAQLDMQLPFLNLSYQKSRWYHSSSSIPLYWLESNCGDPMQVAIPSVDWRKNTLTLSVIHLSEKEEWYLCFSMFHGVGDGYTLTQMLYAFFAILDQRPIPCYDAVLTEHDLPDYTANAKYYFPLKLRCKAADPGERSRALRVIQTESAPYIPTALLCSCVLPFVQDPHAAIAIPVNMRRFCPTIPQIRMGNLMTPMFLCAAGKSAAQLRSEIHDYVINTKLPILRRAAARFYRAFPGFFRRFLLRLYVLLMRHTGRTPMAAMISNVGKVHPEALRCSHFHGLDCWYTFENIPLFAVTLLTVSFGEHSNTCISTHFSRLSEQATLALAASITGIDVFAPLSDA